MRYRGDQKQHGDIATSDLGSTDVGLSAMCRPTINVQMGEECVGTNTQLPNGRRRDVIQPSQVSNERVERVAGTKLLRGADPTNLDAEVRRGPGLFEELRGQHSPLDVLGHKEDINDARVGSNNHPHLRDSTGPLIVSKERVDMEGPRVAASVAQAQVEPYLARDALTLIEGKLKCGLRLQTDLRGAAQLEEEVLTNTVPETQFLSLNVNEENQDLRKNHVMLGDQILVNKDAKGLLSN
ncbi:uroporphyrinogen-III C-methyltransferase [Sesbania bispinosa]|nr:uroporphyrinogen-III C-methyltransferase [Sesbania bispinosa]